MLENVGSVAKLRNNTKNISIELSLLFYFFDMFLASDDLPSIYFIRTSFHRLDPSVSSQKGRFGRSSDL